MLIYNIKVQAGKTSVRTITVLVLLQDTCMVHWINSFAGMCCHSSIQFLQSMYGALDGGCPMLLVEFKKWQCPLSLILQYPCR